MGKVADLVGEASGGVVGVVEDLIEGKVRVEVVGGGSRRLGISNSG